MGEVGFAAFHGTKIESPRLDRWGCSGHTMKKLLVIALGSFVFLAIAGVSAFVALQVLISGEEVLVPELIGKDMVAAVEAVQGLQLNLKIQGREASSAVPKKYILKQIPEGGRRVKAGRGVFVVLSDGMARLRVPELRGALLMNAGNLLQGSELTLGRVSRAPSDQAPVNHVITQSPAPGKVVARGSAVNLLVSMGRDVPTYGMPDLVGRPVAEATALVKALRLRLADLKRAEYPGVPVGTILRHEPRAGEPIRSGMVMRLTVSKKPAVSDQVGTFSVLQYRVPEGLTARRLRILVSSEQGSREVYNQVSAPGKPIRLLIPVHGKTTAKIYLNDKLVSERIYY